MTEQKTFEPITTQEEFDERIKARLSREKEKWAKESGVEDLKAELEQVRADHRKENAERAVRSHLASKGIVDEGRQERIMRHVDLDEVDLDEPVTVPRALVAVQKDLPELFEGRRVSGGAGSGGSSKPVLEPEKPLTRDEIESMSAGEQNQPGMRERINRFLAGER